MSCHMVELLLGSPSVDLSPTERALLADHLAHCRTCRAQHAEFTRLDYLLHQHMAMTPVRDMTETWAKLHTSRTRWPLVGAVPGTRCVTVHAVLCQH
jgi:anti-sigma factor RsiW